MPSLALRLNDFALRSFRDTADLDYVSARLNYRHGLYPQFFWSALQSLEKYLKCILVLNRVKAPRGHHLGELLQLLNRQGGLELGLTQTTYDFLVLLDQCGRYRYFESSWFVEGRELAVLDQSIWDVRRFAQLLYAPAPGDSRPRLDAARERIEVIRVESAKLRSAYRVSDGLLERVLTDPRHPARSALVWQNGWFTTSTRKKVKYWPGLRGENSPLDVYPDLIDEVIKYVWLPKEVQALYRSAA